MQFILDAIAAASPTDIARNAILGGLAGALLAPVIIYVGLLFDLRRIRTTFESVGMPRNAAFFRIISGAGAMLCAVIAASQPVLDAAGEDEIYIRAALLPVLLILCLPFVRAMKRLRAQSATRREP